MPAYGSNAIEDEIAILKGIIKYTLERVELGSDRMLILFCLSWVGLSR